MAGDKGAEYKHVHHEQKPSGLASIAKFSRNRIFGEYLARAQKSTARRTHSSTAVHRTHGGK